MTKRKPISQGRRNFSFLLYAIGGFCLMKGLGSADEKWIWIWAIAGTVMLPIANYVAGVTVRDMIDALKDDKKDDQKDNRE